MTDSSESTAPVSPRPGVSTWLDRTLFGSIPWLTIEVLIFSVIILLAIASRFYLLGERVMSHDESLHTYFSWLLYKGQGYTHNPMMHGPLQFHLIALSYFMFGASDFTARIPAATFSILTIAVIWFWRRYLGRAGALVAATLALISPMLSYYGRYTREDPYVGVSLFLMLYGILRYFETARPRYLYLITGALVIHYLTKETSFIYTAQMWIYLVVYFIARVTQKPWERPEYFRPFIIALAIGVILVGATLGVGLLEEETGILGATETAVPSDPNNPVTVAPVSMLSNTPLLILAGLSAIAIVLILYLLIRGFTWEGIRAERSFDLFILFFTLALPQLSALPVHVMGWNPLDYTNIGIMRTALFLAPMTLIAIGLGLWWNREVWWKAALIFWLPYLLLYTTIFTNGQGFFTGVVGSLGYWVEQHGVERGSQPWYYYVMVQIPMYEFLPALASLLALIFILRGKKPPESAGEQGQETHINLHALLAYWTFTSIFAFSWAGEKMPWLTFHMVLPMALWGGWAIGKIIETVDWEAFARNRGGMLLLLTLVLIMSLFGVVQSTLFSTTPPFQGQELTQLQSTANFFFSALGFAASLGALIWLLRIWPTRQVIYVGGVAFLGLLAILTVRTAYRANYLLYDSAKEYIVYAHGYTGVKDVMRQVDEISERVAGGKSMVVGYDDDVPWPFSWYLRYYTNARYFGNTPSRDLQDVPAIIVGDNNFGKIEPVVKQNFIQYEYIRMVWPNQDYFNLASQRLDPTQELPEDYPCTGPLSFLRLVRTYDYSRVCKALLDPKIREGIFYIWLNRDYTRYAAATGSQSMTPETWSPADRMRLYVRKDIAAQIWNYGVSPTLVESEKDPYEGGYTTLTADRIVGGIGQLNAPRGIAVAPDNSVYIADSRNHRIVHFSAEGQLLQAWGVFADGTLSPAPAGAFNEPWGVAVGPDGSVYVSDTWNHRIQKFTADGQPLLTWGTFGFSSESKLNFYGPRGIEVSADGKVFVADTGNKRIVVFDSNGNYITEFGRAGFGIGEFDEPVDVGISPNGLVYVTDTWNQRVQAFAGSADGATYLPLQQWEVAAWYGTSVENKPFIAVNPANNNVLITDPESFRVIEFTSEGVFVRAWGQFSQGADGFVLPSGITVDNTGHVWVSDGVNSDTPNNRLLRFSLP